MSRALGAPLLTKWGRVHGGRGNRIRHAGNYTGMGRECRYSGGTNETAPEVALTNFQGLTAGLERLMMTIVPARSNSQREARD